MMVPAFARWSGAPESGSPGFGRKKLRTLLATHGVADAVRLDETYVVTWGQPAS